MKRIALAILLAALTLSSVKASEVDVQTTRKVAVAFWNSCRPADLKDVDLNGVTLNLYDGLDRLHIYTVGDNGFVIVAAESSVTPVLAYSFDSQFPKELHPSLQYWLNGYQAQLEAIATQHLEATPQVSEAWNRLLDPIISGTKDTVQTSVIIPVPALLTTRWDQGSPYNKYCPYDSIGHIKTVVGCVATAMAQIIRYWKHPSCGTGSHSYVPLQRTQTAFDTLTADFEHTTYIYAYMPNALYDGISRQRDVDAVATLSYHCGIAVDMMYGSSSGAYSSCGYWTNTCAFSAFTDFFRYKTTTEYAERDNYSDSAWHAKLLADIYAHRPIYYSGHDSSGGHAFVLDGVDTMLRYHVNWGWGGAADGYYYVSNLAPGSGGYGGNATYSFNYGQAAILKLEPIPTQFDTVDVYDTVCYDASSYHFYEYTIAPSNSVVELVHLDTVFRLHLQKSQRRYVYLDANGGIGGEKTVAFCYLRGLVVPNCTFTRDGYRFVGWCPSPDGDDTIYHVGDTIQSLVNLFLYAMWEEAFGIDDVDGTTLTLWPNPTNDEVSVQLPDGSGVKIAVLDALGRTVLRDDKPNVNGGIVKISLQSLPAGTYTIHLSTSKGLYNQPIIKQ